VFVVVVVVVVVFSLDKSQILINTPSAAFLVAGLRGWRLVGVVTSSG
jgi:hypothetical protein